MTKNLRVPIAFIKKDFLNETSYKLHFIMRFAGIFISMLYYGLNLLGVEYFYQMLAIGLVLLFALFIDGLRTRYLEVAKVKGIKV